MNGFDLLAPVYDMLVRLVFGKHIFNAQLVFLSRIKPGDKVLILGGGTGWLLAELLKTQPDCEVWYIESSAKMIELAKKKCNHHPAVHFILGTQHAIPALPFDVVIMNFFLDLFLDEQVVALVKKIELVTAPQGTWIVTDFENEGKWWQRVLLIGMIWFFRTVCGIEAKRLPNVKRLLTKLFMEEITFYTFFHGFIRASSYARKTLHGRTSQVKIA